jgi:hypothetical protein
MLRRAGFSNLIVPLTADQSIFEECGISAEWSMSKTLARECALGPDWTGNGLTREHASKTLSSAFVEVSTSSISPFYGILTIFGATNHFTALSMKS